jgi:hypothetical protein
MIKARDEGGQADRERPREASEDIQPGIPHTTLNAADVGPMKTGDFG